MIKDEESRSAGSYNSFGLTKKNKQTSTKCRSFPFLRPDLRRGRLSERLMKIVCRILHLKSVDPTGPEPVDFTLDESKLIFREIAQELDRILQTRDLSLSTKVSEDESSLEERWAFLLQLAQDIPPQDQAKELNRQTGLSSPCDNVPEENREEACQPKPEEDKRLKKAIADLSTWMWTLKDIEKDSVCLDQDVGEVVEDMYQQWKRGKLRNILPVMDFVIWSILQKDRPKGSIAKYWNRNVLFKSRAVPDSVWKGLKKTKAEVRLDPNTANPCLKISQDRRSVEMDRIVESEYDPWEDFRRTKNKFDGWWCVLGAEGFVSGKHYWEVDIKGKTQWRIGVVCESAPRNGFQDLNTTTGYWVLKLQLGQLMAMTLPVTKLDRCAPSVLGVFLDMEEGQVSFYDMGHRIHIYSFNVSIDCNERIFPLFGTIETERAIRIIK